MIIFYGAYYLEKREGKKGDEKSGEPVGLAKSGKDAILDILDPDVFVDTKMFEDGVEGDNGG